MCIPEWITLKKPENIIICPDKIRRCKRNLRYCIQVTEMQRGWGGEA